MAAFKGGADASQVIGDLIYDHPHQYDEEDNDEDEEEEAQDENLQLGEPKVKTKKEPKTVEN